MTYNQEQLIYWINEREHIRLSKIDGIKRPWSDNPVMQQTYFCNVNREDDRVTKWIRGNWIFNNKDYHRSYEFSMIVARIFNLPSTLTELMQPIDDHLELWLENAEEVLIQLRSDGKRIWNGAYIISTNGKKMDKISYCLMILNNIAKNTILSYNCDTLKKAHQELIKIEGLGSFLAAQIVADLKNTKDHPLNDAEDWFTFSAYGPGSLRGLSWFFDEKVTARNYEIKIKEAYGILEFELPNRILEFLCFQNLQNCFCEYDKFMRVTNGTGRSKRKYKGMGD